MSRYAECSYVALSFHIGLLARKLISPGWHGRFAQRRTRVPTSVDRQPHWIHVNALPQPDSKEIDGKWVAFLPGPAPGAKRPNEQQIIEITRELVDKDVILGAMLSQPSLDVAIFFTTADRLSIWKARQLIQQGLQVRDKDLVWKAEFETDDDWNPGIGNLWFLSELLDALDRKEQSLRQGRRQKVGSIQKNAIDPLIARWRRRLLEDKMRSRSKMVIRPNFPVQDYRTDPRLAFIIMPYAADWSPDVYHVISGVGTELGIEIRRADETARPDVIINDVWRLLNTAGIVIADVTEHNANVFYELGIAHTLGQRVVLLRQRDSHALPFDIGYWRSFEYGLRPLETEEFRKTLRRILRVHLDEFAA